MNIKDIVGPGTTFNVQNMNVFVMGKDDSKKPVINPGIDYGEDGKAKMTPPLQQQLGVMKDAVGVTTDDVTTEPSTAEVKEIEQEHEGDNIEKLKKLAAIFTPTAFPSG